MALNLTNVTYSPNATQNITATGSQALLGQNTTAGASAGGQTPTIKVAGNLTASQAGQALLSSLSNGDSFTGEITDITQNRITIALSDSVSVTATLSNALSYNIGDLASFTIKDNSGSQIILQSNPNAKLDGLMNDQTIQNALHNAGLPVDETNVSLVHEMMKQSVSIDANTMNSYARALETTPSATPEDTVLLMKMGVEVNEENVTALHDYYNYSEGMTGKAEEISKGLQDSLVSLLSDMTAETAATSSDTGVLSQTSNAGEDSLQAQAGRLLSDMMSSFGSEISNPETLNSTMDSADLKELSQMILSLDPDAQNEVITQENGAATLTVVSNNQALSELADRIAQGDVTAKEVLQSLSEFMKDGSLDSDMLKNFLQSEDFKSLTDSTLRQEMFLKPEDVSKDNLKKLMAKITQDTDNISEKLSTQPKAENLVSTLNQARQDVNFLNQVNHFMNFVQIPVKMAGQNAHGDLYVYRNKKGGSSDDELKAMLHLDMDNLGPVDVLVKLKNKNVSTDFKVASDDILDLIEEHIDELNSRLQALGFQVNSVVEKNDGNYSFKKDVVEAELPPVEIKRFSFDVRA